MYLSDKIHGLKCSIDAAKRGFYVVSNSIFAFLVKSDELPPKKLSICQLLILLCGLKAQPFNKYQPNFFDFVVNRFFMKLIKTNDMNKQGGPKKVSHYPISKTSY